MRKRSLYLIILGFVILGIIFIVPRKNKINNAKKISAPTDVTTTPLKEPVKKEKRRVLSPTPTSRADPTEDIITDNTPSEEWQDHFEESLRAQAGDSIETIEIKKTESVIIKRDNRTLSAESVVVNLTKPDGSQSSFRALVDSETGSVLETWDRPVFDAVHPSENFKIKVPAHYHEN